MGTIPAFAFVGRIRCCHAIEDDERSRCTVEAHWIRATPMQVAYGFYCHIHRAPDDRPLAGELVVRRVRLCSEVLFCATSLNPNLALTEAVAAFERGVGLVGGYVNLSSATSAVGRYTAPPLRGAGRGGRGRGH